MLLTKKIYAFDVDGTLTASKSPITLSMAVLVKELMKKSIVIAISGGSFEQFKTQFLPPFLNDESVIPYMKNLKLLPTSGSQRFEFDEIKKEWVLTDKKSLDPEVKARIIKLLQEIIDSGNYDIPPNPAGPLVEDRGTQVTFSGRGQKANIQEKSTWDPDKKKRQKIRAAIEPHLPETSILINAYSSIDILPKGFNKAVGIQLFLDKMGLKKSDLLFVGDGLFPGGNDYSMHEAGFETIPVKGPEETEEIIRGWIS